MIYKHRASGIYWLDLIVSGHRYRRSLRTREKALAIMRARDMMAELRAPKPAGLLWSDFSPRYLEWAKQTKPASWQTEKYRVAIIRPWLEERGLLTLDSVNSYHIEQLRARIMTRKIGDTARTVGRSSANRYLAMIRTMYNRARDWGMYSGENPVSRVKLYRETGRARPLASAEVMAVLEAAERITADPRSPAQAAIVDLVILMLNTGLRRSEALNLRWRDYRGAELDIIGKQDRRRTVPLNAAARAVIERQRREDIFVFPIPNRHQPDNLRRTVKRIRKLSGVEHFHLHLCRHYAMTAMLAAGVDIQTAAEVLGHSRITTSLIYAHTSPERRRRAVEAIEVGTIPCHSPSDVVAGKSASSRK